MIKNNKIVFFAIIALCGVCSAKLNVQSTVYDDDLHYFSGDINMSPFTRIGNKYYYIVTTPQLNWFGAQNYCAQLGSKAATILSDAEMQALNAHLVSLGATTGTYYWLSGSDLEQENYFKWMSTGEQFSYSNWSTGQPDNYRTNEHCVMLWFVNGRFQMNDAVCQSKYNFICEANSPKTVLLNVW